MERIKKYLLNCFLLLVPILIWNIMLTNYLPDSYSPALFWKDIPTFIVIPENILRIIVMALPAIMILSIKTSIQKAGLALYIIGSIFYYMSWILVIFSPESNWSQSAPGFMAPAYTTIIWFAGIGLIGRKSFFKIRDLSMIYIFISVLFVIFHILHTYLVYIRL